MTIKGIMQDSGPIIIETQSKEDLKEPDYREAMAQGPAGGASYDVGGQGYHENPTTFNGDAHIEPENPLSTLQSVGGRNLSPHEATDSDLIVVDGCKMQVGLAARMGLIVRRGGCWEISEAAKAE